jgi:hypothetical protein
MPTAIHRKASARHNESVLLRAAGEATYSRIALAIGHDASYVTRFFRNEQKISLDEALTLLEVCSLQLSAGGDGVVLTRQELDALVLLARKGLESAYTAGDLIDAAA